MQHSLHGNRQRLGIKASTWNCNKGLVDHKGRATAKISTIHNFLVANSIDLLAVNESNLHGPRSNTVRATPLSNEAVHRELAIPGYKIIFPASWTKHDTARIMLYAKNDIHMQVLPTQTYTTELPIILVAARKGAEVKTAFTFMYRE